MSNITDEQLRLVFDLFDSDGSGVVDAGDLHLAFQALGFQSIPQEEVDRALQEYVENRMAIMGADMPSGSSEPLQQLNYQSFVDVVKSRAALRNSREEMEQAFRLFTSVNPSSLADGGGKPHRTSTTMTGNSSSSTAPTGPSGGGGGGRLRSTAQGGGLRQDAASSSLLLDEDVPLITVESLLDVARHLGELPPLSDSSQCDDPDMQQKEAKLRKMYETLVSEATEMRQAQLALRRQNSVMNNNNISGESSSSSGGGGGDGQRGSPSATKIRRGIDVTQWIHMMRSAILNKHNRISQDSVFDIRTRARVAKKGPYGVHVEAGQTYFWCACGHSKTQPFCDNACQSVNERNGTSFKPLKYVADDTKKMWFCGCKQTRQPPLCDGTHASL